MIPKIAINGRKKQPNLVIEYLEKLGGRNENKWIGDDIKGFYWIDDFSRIRCTDNIPEGYKFIDDLCEQIKTKYILVHWPESQHFIGMEYCYYINPMDDINLDQVMFVPENVYNKTMKDLKNIEIKSGDKVHIFGESQKDGYPIDINAIVLNGRGRYIKFIDEVTTKEYTSDYIKEHGFKIHVLGSNRPYIPTGEQTKSKSVKSSNPDVTQKDLDIINTLTKLDWYGTINKKVGDTLFKVQLPEYKRLKMNYNS